MKQFPSVMLATWTAVRVMIRLKYRLSISATNISKPLRGIETLAGLNLIRCSNREQIMTLPIRLLSHPLRTRVYSREHEH